MRSIRARQGGLRAIDVRHPGTGADAAGRDAAPARPGLVDLAHIDAADASLTGAKAANLAIARRAGLPVLPGMVLTTAWDQDGWSHPSRLDQEQDGPVWTTWRRMSDDGRRPVVVRSSSTNEDGGTSSLAGVFTSVLDVTDRMSFVRPVDEVLASARSGLIAGAPMAVLVQPQLSPRWGGVLFGADPVSGRTDRLLVSACAGGPDRLVSGLDDGWTATLSRRGRVLRTDRSDTALGMPALARLCRGAATAFGGPQDIEWAIDDEGVVWLPQSRPITTATGTPTGPVLGTGPLAETFPDPLSQIDPRPGARKLRAAWRVGRLARALPAIGRDVVAQVDGDLLDVPRLDDLSNRALLAVLDNGRAALRAQHGCEALSGMLVPEATTVVTAASIAMSALAEARAEGVEIDDLTRQNPVVLALTAPRVGADAPLSTIDLRSTAATAGAFPPGTGRAVGPGSGATGAAPAAPVADPDDDAVSARPCGCGPGGCRN